MASGKKSKIQTTERLCWINLIITILHMIICIDINGHADRIPYIPLNLMWSTTASCMMTIGILLVVSWVTVVDGGKTRKTPEVRSCESRKASHVIVLRSGV